MCKKLVVKKVLLITSAIQQRRFWSFYVLSLSNFAQIKGRQKAVQSSELAGKPLGWAVVLLIVFGLNL